VNVSAKYHQVVLAPEDLAKAHGIALYYRKAAASFRSIKREGRNDCVPSSFQGLLKVRDIRSTVTVLGEEMKGGPIMLKIVGLGGFPFSRRATTH
jgi:hypothetical protein